MKKQSNLIFSLVLIGYLGLMTACNDEEAEEASTRTETMELLAGEESKTWTLQSIQVNGSDAISFLHECDTDDHYILYRNGKGKVLANEIRCEEDEPDVLSSGDWELHEDLKTLSLHLPPFSDEDVEITELTEGRLQISQVRGQDTMTGTYIAVD